MPKDEMVKASVDLDGTVYKVVIKKKWGTKPGYQLRVRRQPAPAVFTQGYCTAAIVQ